MIRTLRRFAISLLLMGCPNGAELAPSVAPHELSFSGASGLESVCTPTGVEICFDAKDNNCDGAIDEGCGLHTGLLQFTVAWDASSADVDLNVFDPGGELARTSDPTTTGLLKDRDCPKSADCRGQNVENVFLAEGSPTKGVYRVVVRLEKNSEPSPVRVRLGARIGQRSLGASFDLSPGSATEEKVLEFKL